MDLWSMPFGANETVSWVLSFKTVLTCYLCSMEPRLSTYLKLWLQIHNNNDIQNVYHNWEQK